MWDFIFSTANMLAMICWAALILLPRKPLVLSLIMYLGVGLLCLVYSAGLISIVAGWVDPVGTGSGGETSFSTIEGVRACENFLVIVGSGTP